MYVLEWDSSGLTRAGQIGSGSFGNPHRTHPSSDCPGTMEAREGWEVSKTLPDMCVQEAKCWEGNGEVLAREE